MRASYVVAMATLMVGLSLSFNVGLSSNLRGLAPQGAPSFTKTLSKDTLRQMVCPNGSCDPDALGFQDLSQKALLELSGGIHDLLNDKETIPFLPHPLNLLRGTKRPSSTAEVVEAFQPVHKEVAANDSYPYFGFLPKELATLTPNGQAVAVETDCWGSLTMSSMWTNKTMIQWTFTAANQKKWFCSDDLAILGHAIALQGIAAAKTYTINMDVSDLVSDPANLWYINNVGFFVGKFEGGFLEAIGQLISTVTFLIGFAEPTVKGATFEDNFNFITTYFQYNATRMGPRATIRNPSGDAVAAGLNESEINSGDIFVIIRPDGLDPMIAWARGGSAGHITMALRDPVNGTLYVCESTTLDAYWPTNGNQCHEWKVWYPLANTAQYNVIHLPMKASRRAMLNETAAWDYFSQVEGFNYGYLVLLSGWLDIGGTSNANSPCLPPKFDRCLSQPLISPVFVLIDTLMGNNRENLVRQMFTHRIGVWPQEYTIPQSMQYGAENLNLTTVADIYSIVEEDSWMYNTTRFGMNATGPAMVCNVFVCNMMKHAGVFSDIDSDFQCGESTIRSMYILDMWDSAKSGSGRPQICQQADPNNQWCQIMGNWTWHLAPMEEVNSIAPYKNMGNYCPSQGPNYIQPHNC